MVHLVQIRRKGERRVALVQEPELVLLRNVSSVYELATQCLQHEVSLSDHSISLAKGDTLPYDDVYNGRSPWSLMAPIDVPNFPERLLVSGTGLTHFGSAKDRQSMHLKTATDPSKPITDSMRMFELGLVSGRPNEGQIGVAPEWFYKGNGSIVKAPFEALYVPPYAEDGGEEAELAGVYFVASDGSPVRVGICTGNEFADHAFERLNYLNLAGSKLRSCSLGPELVVDADFSSVAGKVSIERDDDVVWSKLIESGEENMAHSLANLEHHHFKFEGHRQPGHMHVHYFGAHSLSFGEDIRLEEGDWMHIEFEGYGRPLRNPVAIAPRQANQLTRIRVMH